MEVGTPSEFVCRDGLQPPVRNVDQKYTCYRDKRDARRLWLVGANTLAPADHIYVGYREDTGSKGYGGRHMIFNLTDHNMAVTLQGPWHSNSDALYENTGIDLRDKHYVQLVVGLSRRNGPSYRTTLTDIVYYEPPGVRAYDGYKATMRELYEKYRCDLYYWHGGSGGSTCGTYGERDYNKEPVCPKC